MRNLGIGLVFAALAVGLAFSLTRARFQSRFAVSWMHSATIAALGVPAALVGEWLLATSLLATGLVLLGLLSVLERQQRRKRREGL